MDAIKKKMQAMKLEKDNAMDRAQMCEQQAKDANLRAEKVGSSIPWQSLLVTSTEFSLTSFLFIFFRQAEEEARSLQKKIQQIENDLDQTQEQLMQVNAKLEEKDKALQNVSILFFYYKFRWERKGLSFHLTTFHMLKINIYF